MPSLALHPAWLSSFASKTQATHPPLLPLTTLPPLLGAAFLHHLPIAPCISLQMLQKLSLVTWSTSEMHGGGLSFAHGPVETGQPLMMEKILPPTLHHLRHSLPHPTRLSIWCLNTFPCSKVGLKTCSRGQP